MDLFRSEATMPARTLVAVAAALFAGAVAGCGGHSTLTNTGITSPTLSAVGLKITAPDAIAPGQTVPFVATASMSDGTTQDYTRKVTWSAVPTSVMTISSIGQATAQAAGDVSITATLAGGTCCRPVTITRTVLPPNTYRLIGTVSESSYSVTGGVVAVLSGVGVGLSATTNGGGSYQLYGVAGPIQLKFSKAGYDDIVKTFTATQNDVLDFPEAHQTGGLPSLAGSYSLTLSADPGCPTIPVAGIVPLPDDFRQPRTYAASLTQNGPELTVRLTDPGMIPYQNHFMGRVAPDGIDFQVKSWSYYYYGNPELIAEQLSGTQKFEFGGQLHAQRSGDAIAGHLDGTIEVISPSPASSGMCVATSHQMTMTRTARPSRAR